MIRVKFKWKNKEEDKLWGNHQWQAINWSWNIPLRYSGICMSIHSHQGMNKALVDSAIRKQLKSSLTVV